MNSGRTIVISKSLDKGRSRQCVKEWDTRTGNGVRSPINWKWKMYLVMWKIILWSDALRILRGREGGGRGGKGGRG